jgi:hypothetical protein
MDPQPKQDAPNPINPPPIADNKERELKLPFFNLDLPAQLDVSEVEASASTHLALLPDDPAGITTQFKHSGSEAFSAISAIVLQEQQHQLDCYDRCSA